MATRTVRVVDVRPKCPECGAVGELRVTSSQRRSGTLYRYSVCRRCGARVTVVVDGRRS